MFCLFYFFVQNTVLKKEIGELEKKLSENKNFHEKEHLKVIFIKFLESIFSKYSPPPFSPPFFLLPPPSYPTFLPPPCSLFPTSAYLHLPPSSLPLPCSFLLSKFFIKRDEKSKTDVEEYFLVLSSLLNLNESDKSYFYDCTSNIHKMIQDKSKSGSKVLSFFRRK